MSTVMILTKRNIKMFFKDKGMFFTSLITPAILLVLYATFLAGAYRDSLVSAIPEQFEVSGSIIDGLVAGQLTSSILAVSCVTVAFCSNFMMVHDRANGTIKDLRISPVKAPALSMSYYAATLVSTLIICFAAVLICLVYMHFAGGYLPASDVALLMLDVVILVIFGTALSSVINFFLSSQGQISAVGTIVSAGYGFICGAYMPIASFGEGLQSALSFLPGTYGTSLVRNHSLNGAFDEMARQDVPQEIIDGMRDALDCNIYLFDENVSIPVMYMILSSAIVVLIAAYIVINTLSGKSYRTVSRRA